MGDIQVIIIVIIIIIIILIFSAIFLTLLHLLKRKVSLSFQKMKVILKN